MEHCGLVTSGLLQRADALESQERIALRPEVCSNASLTRAEVLLLPAEHTPVDNPLTARLNSIAKETRMVHRSRSIRKPSKLWHVWRKTCLQLQCRTLLMRRHEWPCLDGPATYPSEAYPSPLLVHLAPSLLWVDSHQ